MDFRAGSRDDRRIGAEARVIVMIDGLYKSFQDRFWDVPARWIARTGITANQITVIGVLLTAANCAAYLEHRSSLTFGILLALCELLDDLDGAVARVTGTCSKFGAYLDATTDRYKETLVLGAVAWVTGLWALCYVALAGSLITSYNKARAGMEVPISNADWPDLFERFERLVVLIAGLILSPFFAPTAVLGGSVLRAAVGLIAALSVFSSVQRLLRARRLLHAHER